MLQIILYQEQKKEGSVELANPSFLFHIFYVFMLMAFLSASHKPADTSQLSYQQSPAAVSNRCPGLSLTNHEQTACQRMADHVLAHSHLPARNVSCPV